jgi:hypothetical protein
LFILIWYVIHLAGVAAIWSLTHGQARALVHLGSLNRKSRPERSIGEPLNKLLKNFKDVIEDFSQFCEYV